MYYTYIASCTHLLNHNHSHSNCTNHNTHLMEDVGAHDHPEVLFGHLVALLLSPVHHDDVVGMESHLVEEVEEALQSVSVWFGKKEAEETECVSPFASRLHLCTCTNGINHGSVQRVI